ncbi:intercellular trafficking and secretion [Rhizopogon vesiculosus]|uniref:Sorting nexin-4 n=1 Tax=Rhizopogon vesiculosus TaxID=180088 RepID=A0A1J8R7G0_9AGAM|nr:intercellular trafficking and secretion [Rhizopogon vesiculosus]
MHGDDEDVFDSVTWESPSAPYHTDHTVQPSGPGFKQSTAGTEDERGPHDPKWEGYLIVTVKDPVKELAETKDAYVSYLVSAKTNLPIFSTPNPSSRRRFQDFVFLRDHLVKDFPACVVPALPDKHRLEYFTGDRFSPEFMERRRLEYAFRRLQPCLRLILDSLHRFLERISRHPTLQRSTLVRAFFESTEWHVHMHQHLAHPPGPEPTPGLIDNISDTLLNAFARVRKPDERFLDMRESVDKFEDGLVVCERLWGRVRNRTNGGNFAPGEDLTADYHDLAVAVQGLGFLESGITDPLNHFSNTLLEFSALLRHKTQTTTDPFLVHLHSLLTYSHANRAVLKLRDQKQLDFEELSDYLSGVTQERDRLSAVISGHAGSTGLGLSAYLKDKVDALRGADDDRSRVEKMRKLDVKIKELQDAVTTAHETSDAFSDETLREQTIFQYTKEAEMKDMLGNLADGEIEFYQSAMEEWERIIPIIQRIRVDV